MNTHNILMEIQSLIFLVLTKEHFWTYDGSTVHGGHRKES